MPPLLSRYMQYNKINNLLGWLCFVIASATYILTLEPSVSFWDCGEFISCAYRLQVSHQPGYPVFAMLGKVFSLLSLGDNTKVPYFTNMGSALASGATVMFLFWTITAIAKKLVVGREKNFGQAQTTLIMGAGLVGALAFTYTDTFWFSAVETIVFALSSLCIAIIFWAILKWEAHADEPRADKWIIFIAYVIGLSIGIHLLNLLTIPALALVYYFRRYKNITVKSAFIAFLVSVVILAFVQYGIRGYTVKFAAFFDLFFVNSLGMGFGTGAIFFLLLLVGILIFGIQYSIKKNMPTLNLAFLCVTFIYFGYGSFAYIPIRATANTNLNNSHPDNAFTMYGYLNRIQYGENPLFTGPYFDSKIVDQTEGSTIYRKGAKTYEVAGTRPNYVYDRTTILPRMYSTDGQDVQFYRDWLQLPEGQSPTFADNMRWMVSWQIYQMYGRYFLWNFVGRYNDQDGQNSTEGYDGNWTSGIFDGGKHLPNSVIHGTTYTPLYALPLILGLIGMIYHFNRKKRDALIVLLLWFFTGIAVVLYVNQANVQPRERDYSYVGSFYAFAIWIGLAVIAIADLLSKKINAKTSAYIATGICLLAAPVLMAAKEWKAHDRSTKMTPHDMAYNYLISCPPNAILFTYGDNDTYSLWYDQEVEGIRPDVRIVNLSLFTGDWYIRQMQKPMNQSAPLPITMPYDKYKEGVRDVIYYNDAKIPGYTDVKEVFDFITSDDKSMQGQNQGGESVNYLPTKKFKLKINADDVLKNGVITADQKSKLDTAMQWTYTSNYVTKENLAILDILAHNNWKRPICFTTTIGNSNLIGLQPYLYKEGFTYRLIPFKPDTANQDQLSKTNSLIMYNNVMNKFKYGNYKTAKYLDHESTNMFYPVLLTTFLDLARSLEREGHPDLALKVLHKCDDVLPDLNPYIDVAGRKLFMAQIAYRLGDPKLGNKLVNAIDSFLTDQLNYNYYQLQNGGGNINVRDVQIGLQVLNGITEFSKAGHQDALSNKLSAQLKDYATKFAPVLGKE
ncbi:MAG: multidrug transporter [Mucilaginibacter sp.]|nr:multidrug transporter [Mucilaginibacter sp.]